MFCYLLEIICAKSYPYLRNLKLNLRNIKAIAKILLCQVFSEIAPKS